MFFRAVAVAAFVVTGGISVASPAEAQSCPKGYYRAASGDCVHRPICGLTTQPPGATALCNDGCWSFSENPDADETCSSHQGTAKVL
jgi:hypothetical protein